MWLRAFKEKKSEIRTIAAKNPKPKTLYVYTLVNIILLVYFAGGELPQAINRRYETKI